MGFEGFPLIVGWELTLACNLRCRHCGSDAGRARADELTLQEALNICDQLPPLLVQEVNFTGGEPLLHPDWPAIVERLRMLRIQTKMLTNGLLLRPDVVRRMADLGVAAVGVSLDGGEATHDRIREDPGLFRRALAGMEELRRADIPSTVITTVNALNIDELPALADLLVAAGVKRWQVQPIFPTGRSGDAVELLLSDADYMKLGIFIKEWSPKAEAAVMELGPADSFGYFTDCDTRSPQWRGCPGGVMSCGITSDGKIKGCLSMPDDLIEGDLRVNDLWDIWFHPDSFRRTRRFSHADLGPNCRDCEHGDQCQGGCTTMSYGSTGRCHNDPLCFTRISRGVPAMIANH